MNTRVLFNTKENIMNQIPQNEENKKSPLVKTLAVMLFIFIVIICAWAAVRLAMFVPSTFSSLADLAESVYGHDPMNKAELEMSLSDDSVKSDTIMSIDWNDIEADGEYLLSYECTDGVAVDVRVDDEIKKLDCDESLTLPARVFTLDAYVASEKSQVAYVTFTLQFVGDDNKTALKVEKFVTITNDNIPDRVVVEESEEEVVEEVKPTPTTPAQPITTWKYVEPVSDPNGRTDLQVTYLGVGIVNSQDVFVAKSYLEEDEEGAFQFVVKNIGTKTSSNWYFEGELPSGTEFESGNQTVLRPKEKATFTISFPSAGRDGNRNFGIKVFGGSDINTTNNGFNSTVSVK